MYTPYSFYQVFSIDYDGKKSASNIVKIKNTNYDIKIFPNPINLGSTLNIEHFDKEKNIKFRILDVLSKVVIPDQFLNEKNEIDIQVLKPGTYTLMLFTDSDFVDYKTFIVTN
ncbi:MAG: T9SS type A sorting domain-containing protein [Saprospiraceae bacterium]|nr:T9SS type A sorting domain-containing protein [Saprospiraceae bacterium]